MLISKAMNSPRVIKSFQGGQGKYNLTKASEKSCTADPDQQQSNIPNTASIQDLIAGEILQVNFEGDMNTPKKEEGDINDHSFFESKIKSATEEKIKELTEQNAKLENECLKFQRQLKSMEVKIQETNEKNYKSTTNTSSKFILPSEVKQMWDSIAQEHIVDTFIDFFENQKLAYYLVSEFFYVNIEIFRSVFHLKIKRIFEQLKIPFGQNTLVSVIKLFRPIIEEFFENIFYDPEEEDTYVKNIKNLLFARLKSQLDIDESKHSDLMDCLESKYFREFVNVMKKLILYCEMHEPPLKFEIASIKERKPIIKCFKLTEIICTDGLPKENKKCLMMIAPPMLKSYYYMGLKPIVVAYAFGMEEFENDNDECYQQLILVNKISTCDLSPSINPSGLELNKESSITLEDKVNLNLVPINQQAEIRYSPDLRSKHELLKQTKSAIRSDLTLSTPNFKKEESKNASGKPSLENEEKELLPHTNLYYSTSNLKPSIINKELSTIKERIFEKIIEKDSSRNIQSIQKYDSNKCSQSNQSLHLQMACNNNSISQSLKLVDCHLQIKSDSDQRNSLIKEEAKRVKENNKCYVHSTVSATQNSTNKKSRQKINYPNCLNGFKDSKSNKTAVCNNYSQLQNKESDYGLFCTGQSNLNYNYNHNTMDVAGEDLGIHLFIKKEPSKSESLDLRDIKGANNSYKLTSSSQLNAKNIKLNQHVEKKANSNSSTPSNTVFYSSSQSQNQHALAQSNQVPSTHFTKSLVSQPTRTKESQLSTGINNTNIKGNAELKSSINSKTNNDNSLNKTHSYNKNSQSNSSNSNIILQSNQTGVENRIGFAASTEIIDDMSLQIKKRQTSIDNPKLAGFLNSNQYQSKDDQDAVKISLNDYHIKSNDAFYSTLVTPKSRGNKQSHFKMQMEGKDIAHNKNMDALMSNTLNEKGPAVNSFKKNFSSSLKNKSNKNELNEKSSPLNLQAPTTEAKKISIISTTISSISPGPVTSVNQPLTKQQVAAIHSSISPKSSTNLYSNMKKSKTKNYFESKNEMFVNSTLQTSSKLSNNPSSNHRSDSTSNAEQAKGKVVNPDLYKLIEVNYCNQLSNGIRKEAMLSNMNSKSKSDFRSTSHHNLLYGGSKREINNSCELDSNNNYIYQDCRNPGTFISQAKNRKIIENLIHSSRSKALKIDREDCNDLPECSEIPLYTEIVERKKNLNLNSSFDTSFSKMKKEENLTEVNDDSEIRRKGGNGTREINASNSNFVASKQDLKSENRSPCKISNYDKNELNYIDCETVNCKNEMYILGEYSNTKLYFHEKKRSEGSHMLLAQPIIEKFSKASKKESFLSAANNYSSNQTKSKMKQPSAYKVLGYPNSHTQLQSKTFKNFEPKSRKEEKVVVNLAQTHTQNPQVQVDFASTSTFKPSNTNFQSSNSRKLSHSRKKINSSVAKVNEQLTDQNRMSKPQSKGKISTFQGEIVAIKKQTTKIIHSIKNSKNKFPSKKPDNHNSALMHDGQMQYSYRDPHSEAPSSNQTIDKSEFAKNTQDLNFNKDLRDDNDFEFLIKESLGTFNSGMKRPQSKTPKQQRVIEHTNNSATNPNFGYNISPQQESSPKTITINNYVNKDKLTNKHVNLKRFPSQSKDTMLSEHKFSIQKIKAKADTKILSEIRKVCSSLSKEKCSPTINTNSDQINELFTLKSSPSKNSKSEPSTSLQGNLINHHYHDTAPLQLDSAKQIVQSNQAAYMHNLQSNQNVRKASLNTSIVNNSNSNTYQQQQKQDSNHILNGTHQGPSEISSTSCNGNIKKYIGASASLSGSIKVASTILMGGGQLPNSSKEVGNLKGSSLIQQSDLSKVKPGIFSSSGNSGSIKVISKNDSKGRISPNYFLKK